VKVSDEVQLVHNTRGQLISQHYLQTQLPKWDDWAAVQHDPRVLRIEELYDKVRPILIKNKPNSKGSNEQAVRDLLLNPVLEILGLPWSPAVQHFGKQLDYALYDSHQSFEEAQLLISNGKEIEALRTSCAVAEAERWGKEFGDKPKKSDLSDPIFQIEFYLGNARRSGGPRWGVLTNGHTWRLYCGDSDPLRHDFLEVELPIGDSLFAHQERASFLLKGDFKLVADQSDRKATGSYYTPHIVVEFIGRNVLKPLLDEIEAECQDDPGRIIERVLSQRVLDPAMGSGHFLVFAVEYLADYVFGQMGRARAALEIGKKRHTDASHPVLLPLDSSIEFVRARIAERCVYGVDINPLAVELAKLSLWIATASKGAPLSFLNHHLRCGDSLLGVSSREFHHDIFAYKLVQQMGLAVGFIRYINDSFSNTLKDVGEKEEHLKVAREHLRRFRLTYDAHLGPLFSINIGEGFHSWLDGVGDPIPKQLPEWLRAVEETASQFRFFHWELEFPEVWRDRHGRDLAEGNELQPGFDIILGNPPFVTAKNELARRAYMERWTTAVKGFHLLVPFFERAFEVLRTNGRLGLIVSNGFAKREFGKKLVEEFLPTVTIDEVIDCSGLSFPGHGTPTCIVFGIAAPSPETHKVKVTATTKGDLRTAPEDSPLWSSIRDHHACVGYSDEWIGVTARPKVEMAVHPWIFSADAKDLLQLLSKVDGSKLENQCAEPIGAQFITGADDVYVLPWHLARRSGIPQQYIRLYASGEDVRDWQVTPSAAIVFPYDENLAPLAEPLPTELHNVLSPFRDHLENLIISGSTPKRNTNLKWFEYRRLARAKLNVSLNIIFPQISMYNHACLSDHSIVFKEKAQAIALKNSVSKQVLHAVAGCLNSSIAGFWLKQVSFNKGPGKKGEHDRFEFSGNILSDFVIPAGIWETSAFQKQLSRLSKACWDRGKSLVSLGSRMLFAKPGEAYDAWYRGLPGYTAHQAISTPFESANELVVNVEKAKDERSRLWREMVALQEEIDWISYAMYGLIRFEDPATGIGVLDTDHPWELACGHRSFELASANAGPPIEWDKGRRELWAKRQQAINANSHISSIERSVFKRRWIEVDFEREFEEAGYEWLREKAEYHLQHSGDASISIDDWAAVLWQDARVRAFAVVLDGEKVNLERFRLLLKKAVEEQTVPNDPTKFKAADKQIRGKLNVPRERFREVGGDQFVLAGSDMSA
jgi:hypothetical protein